MWASGAKCFELLGFGVFLAGLVWDFGVRVWLTDSMMIATPAQAFELLAIPDWAQDFGNWRCPFGLNY